jgi:hypothetical protein
MKNRLFAHDRRAYSKTKTYSRDPLMPSDPLHRKPLYPTSNSWGIPDLSYPVLPTLPQELYPYRQRVKRDVAQAAVHFFLFDAVFESVWNYPTQAQQFLRRFPMTLTPDFSLNADMPLAVQLWNTYRTRWCGAHWQAQGLTVIPTVSWSTPASYAFCFLGIPRYSPVALTTLGSRASERRGAFLHGFAALVEQVQPKVVLCYGEPLPAMERVPLQVYPDRWQRVQQERDHGR